MQMKTWKPRVLWGAMPLILCAGAGNAVAAPVAGGTLDPTTIPKYVTPLVIPPVMNDSGVTNDYDIAVRQFQQQILPGGIWAGLPGCTGAGCTFPATTVWSYGPAADPTPAVAPAANSQFNYPAYTMENISDVPVTVDWINDLVADPDACKTSTTPTTDPDCNFISHITPVDRSLHWANPELLPCSNILDTTDCRPDPTKMVDPLLLQQPYLGPVPIITHVHGAHVNPDSDGYPEAWWLPAANNIPPGFAIQGKLVNNYGTAPNTNVTLGVGNFSYRNDQPSTTLWYHDHTLGMTRNNVYAGPAGFWLIREAGGGETGLNEKKNTLPAPAPVAGDTVLELNAPTLVSGTTDKRSGIREIPIVIQDRSFNIDGSLFYPGDRAFFQEVKVNQVNIPFIGDPDILSDISAIWNPEAFFNTIVVNGVTWPSLDVAQAQYRLRLLNGSNSRFLNLSMFIVNPDGTFVLNPDGTIDPNSEVPFYQIGGDQSLLPNVVEVKTGFKTVLPGDGTTPAATLAAAPQEALLMGLAERADVIVDFSGLADGTIVRMINTAPDSPFGGFDMNTIAADPGTSGQVMQFVVNLALNGASATDPVLADGTTPNPNAATAPQNLVLSRPDQNEWDKRVKITRDMALLEEESLLICVKVAPNGVINYDSKAYPDPLEPGTCLNIKDNSVASSVPMGPREAVLGTSGSSTNSVATLWSDLIVTNPGVGDTETWELWNWSADAHPIHVHLVKYKVLNRQAFDPMTGVLDMAGLRPAEATEAGWKDTVIAYPGEVTRFNATFDIPGLYVWHCHIVEHEDNEMMVPFCVENKNGTRSIACDVADGP